MKDVRVLLADDHKIVAEGVRTLLEKEFILLGTVEDGATLVEQTLKLKPDVVVTDISMPVLTGIEATRQLVKARSKAKIVILTMHNDPTYARRALNVGASGFVLKHSAPSQLIKAIHDVVEGRTYLSPELEQITTQEDNGKACSIEQLTPRQREVLQLLAEGHSAKEIASELHISPRTAEFHKYQMMGTLELGSTAELIHFAFTQGLVPKQTLEESPKSNHTNQSREP